VSLEIISLGGMRRALARGCSRSAKQISGLFREALMERSPSAAYARKFLPFCDSRARGCVVWQRGECGVLLGGDLMAADRGTGPR